MLGKIPNIISFSRLLASFVFYWLFQSQEPSKINIACYIYFFAAISDTLDGWAARRFGSVTRWGEFFDPLADKFLTLLAFFAFYKLDVIPLWILILLLIRDIFSTYLRVIAIKNNNPVQTSKSAKFKTTVQMFFIGYILVLFYIQTNRYNFFGVENIKTLIYSDFTYFAAVVVALLALYSILGYIVKYSKIFAFFSKKLQKTS